MEHSLEHEEAQCPAISAERLVELSADSCLSPLVAGNPAASANLLEDLAQDQDSQVRQMVASNPQTPWPVLERLAWEFPHAFLHNPVGPLQIREHPEQISTDDLFWGALLRDAELPLPWWNWLNSHPVLGTSTAVRLHIQTAGETHQFAGDLQEEDEQILLQLLNLLSDAYETFCLPGERYEQLKEMWKQIIEERFHFLAQSTTSEMREKVAWHLRAPEEIGDLLAHDQDATVRLWLARSPRTSERTLRVLARDEDIRIRTQIIWHERMPTEVLATLAYDPTEEVRAEVAGNPRTPAEIVSRLSQDQAKRVRSAVARNPQTPGERLFRLAHDPTEEVRRAVAGNPQTPTVILSKLAYDPAVLVRTWVAGNPQTPREMLSQLAQDPVERVREVVARNDLTSDLWSLLAQDQSVEVRRTVARNLQTPIDVLCALAQDQEVAVRREVAGRREIPEQVLHLLAHDHEREVRRMTVWPPYSPVPTEVLNRLAQDQDGHVRQDVAWHSQTPEKVLRALAQDHEAVAREAIAGNLQTPEEVLRVLAQDQDPRVRQRAGFSLRLLAKVEGLAYEGRKEDWREQLGRFLWQALGTASCLDLTITEQLIAVTDPQDMPETIRQAIITALAGDWEAFLSLAIWGEAFGMTLMPIFLAVPPLALQKLAAADWTLRYLVALHPHTSQETRQQLCQDGNRYVRAMARAIMEKQPTPDAR